MVVLGKKTGRNRDFLQLEKSQMLHEMMNHPAWQGEKSLSEIESRLKDQTPFTFALSHGMEKYHFFLSYVAPDGLVKHKNIRIVLTNGNWNWKNGGIYTYDAIHQLIPSCLVCSDAICKPLVVQ